MVDTLTGRHGMIALTTALVSLTGIVIVTILHHVMAGKIVKT